MPFRDPHTAAPCLWAIRDATGPGFEVSYATPTQAAEPQLRKGLEAALIARYRRVAGESPTANFGRIIPGYQQSSYSRTGDRGGPLTPDATEPNAESGVGPLPWTRSDDVLAPNWMGLDWSQPYRLADRLDAPIPDTGLYRIWEAATAPPLSYIGESSDIPRRLYSHEQRFGSDALLAVVDRADLTATHQRLEIETELIGAHHLAHGEPPTEQFG